MSEWPWNESMPWDERLWIHPHVEAPTTLADLLAGHDPALEAALTFDDAALCEWLGTRNTRVHYQHPSQQPALEARQVWPFRFD